MLATFFVDVIGARAANGFLFGCPLARRSSVFLAEPRAQLSDEERNEMLAGLMSDGSESYSDGRPLPSTDIPSHVTLRLSEDGEPELARFTYVDEDTCIGCKNCAFVARSTFFMEESLGRARVYNQGGDSEDLIEEAIDSCPVRAAARKDGDRWLSRL